jgi:hypothetical protein
VTVLREPHSRIAAPTRAVPSFRQPDEKTAASRAGPGENAEKHWRDASATLPYGGPTARVHVKKVDDSLGNANSRQSALMKKIRADQRKSAFPRSGDGS